MGLGDNYETLRGSVTGTRYQRGQPTNVGITASGALRWRPTPQDAVNVNLQLAPTWNATETRQIEYTQAGAVRSTLLGKTDYDDNQSAELGADWEHRFSDNLSAKGIVLLSQGTVDQHDRFEIFQAPATRLVRTQDRLTETGERIARGQLKWNVSPAHTLEFGGEGAFNFRETSLDIVNTPDGGVPTPVPLAVSDARVEEVRGEAFVTDIWTVSPQLTLELGFNFEVSRITQTGDQQKERSFEYPKPRFVATYVFDERNTLRFSLIKDVSQLDFSEFASAIDFVNASQTQGNPDLVPEQAWKSRVELETRFGDRGALTMAVFADRVEDVRDLVVIGGLDAYGNIGDGTRIGAEVRAATPLSFVGLPNAELRFNALYQETEVTDPITGERRSFSVPSERQGTPSGAPVLNAGNKDWAYVVNFRHNLPTLSSSYGFNVVQWAARREYRRAESYFYKRDKPRIDLFFETTAVRPVTLRLFVNNILPASEERIRSFYVGDRSSGVIGRVEERRALGGPEGSRSIGFQISGRI
jgi:hypothetical protein